MRIECYSAENSAHSIPQSSIRRPLETQRPPPQGDWSPEGPRDQPAPRPIGSVPGVGGSAPRAYGRPLMGQSRQSAVGRRAVQTCGLRRFVFSNPTEFFSPIAASNVRRVTSHKNNRPMSDKCSACERMSEPPPWLAAWTCRASVNQPPTTRYAPIADREKRPTSTFSSIGKMSAVLFLFITCTLLTTVQATDGCDWLGRCVSMQITCKFSRFLFFP